MPQLRKNSNSNSNSNSDINSNSNTEKRKTFRSHHTNYTPFLKYIEHHSLIDDATKQLVKSKYGNNNASSSNASGNSNTPTTPATRNSKNTRTMPHTMPTDPASASSTIGGKFNIQKSKIKTRKERDEDRHADLHANYKAKDFTDSDKIFLLKREIANLKGNANNPQQQSQQGIAMAGSSSSSSSPMSSNLPLLSVLLFLGVAMVAARFLTRKLRFLRATDSLLAAGNGEFGEFEIGYRGNDIGSDSEGISGVELREHPYEAPGGIEHAPSHGNDNVNDNSHAADVRFF